MGANATQALALVILMVGMVLLAGTFAGGGLLTGSWFVSGDRRCSLLLSKVQAIGRAAMISKQQ